MGTIESANLARAINNQDDEWIPGESELLAIDLLAQGYNQTYVARQVGTTQPVISHWLHRHEYSEQFREAVRRRALELRAQVSRVEDTQIILATGLVHQALQGEVQRDADGNIPVSLQVAIELLRNTRWRMKVNEDKERIRRAEARRIIDMARDVTPRGQLTGGSDDDGEEA